MRLVAILFLAGAGVARADDGTCVDVVVGPKHEAARQCYEQEEVTRPIAGDDAPAIRILDHYALRVVRDKKLVTLIDVPVKAEMYDGIPRRPGEPVPPWHPFELASDGQSLIVGDPQDAEACKHAVSRPGTSKSDRVWLALDRDLHDRNCKARGRYVWTNGRFTAARKT